MNATLQLLAIPLSVGMLLAVMAGLKHLSHKVGLSAEVQRKSIHMGTGLFAMSFPWLFPLKWPVFVLLGLTLVVMGVLRLPAFAKSGLGSTLHGVERQSYGDFLLVFAVGAIFLLSQGDPLLYALPIAVLTLSDAAAALAGSAYGRRKFPVADGAKSLEGVAIFFLVTWILSMVALLLLSDIDRGNVILLSLMIAAFGALVEADSWRGYDNLFVPLGVFLLLASGLGMSSAALIGLAVFFMASLLVICMLAASVGFATHTARAYVVAVFLIMAASTPQNAILPIAALLAHAAARLYHRCKAEFPDLDILAAIALMSVVWLACGTVMGPSSINFYGLAFVGFTLLLAVLSTASLPVIGRGAIILGVGAVLVVIHRLVSTWNGLEANWFGDLTLVIAGTLAVSVAVPALLPRWFDRRRGPKTALVSSLLPAGVYLTASFFYGTAS